MATTFYETEISGGEFFLDKTACFYSKQSDNQAVTHEIQKTSGLIRSLFCFTLYNVQFSLNVDNLTVSVMLK